MTTMRIFSIVMTLLCIGNTNAQLNSVWSDKAEARMDQDAQRTIVPQQYRTVQANVTELRSRLDAAPQESNISPGLSEQLFRIPKPEGGFDVFRVVEYSMMESGLADKFPEIKTYRGIHIDDPWKTIRMQWTVHGFGAMISGADSGKYFVVPYAKRNQQDYISYYKNDFESETTFECEVRKFKNRSQTEFQSQRVSGDCTFRSYRLAVACTGEYANFHDANDAGDVDTLLSAVVIAVNRVNEVYERDVAVRMLLVENTTSVFYYDGSSDPYTNGNGGAMLNQNQATIDEEVGSANYDIGHVFSTGGGGVANLGVPCVNGWKAKGVTGQASPIDDPFYIDYVAHEMGHQFGANHTQNNSCNRNSSTAMEPGSASTIMGYAGICSPNVQNNSDDYFHSVSVQEINVYVSSDDGNNCDVPIAWTNNPPEVTSGTDYTIPISTPFVLTAEVSDPDGDPLRYQWDQYDNETGSMPPSATNTQGPMFRSFSAVSSPSRYFPRLSDLVNNIDPTWETLPSVSRNMDFRITAYDFHNGMAGCSDEDNITVTTSVLAGPFVVLGPNDTSVTWSDGSMVDVTWDVANTTASPVSCSHVDIFLSYDGGLTYPETLAINTPNDGSAMVMVPDGETTTARVMIKGHDNVFFDISDQDFKIVDGTPDYALIADTDKIQFCELTNESTAIFEIAVAAFNGYEEEVTLSIDSIPPGTQGGLSETVVTAGDTVMLFVSKLVGLGTGSYGIGISATSELGDRNLALRLEVIDTSAIVALSTPSDNADDIDLQPTFAWAALPGITSYEWEVSDDSLFGTIVASISTDSSSFSLEEPLDSDTDYFWRVRGGSDCHISEWSETFMFKTRIVVCVEEASQDVPVSISPTGTPTIISTLNIAEGGIISSVKVLDVDISHTWVGDLEVALESPEGTEVILVSEICGNTDDLLLSFDDEADDPAPCPPNDGGTYQPMESLSAFLGEDMQGDWTLRVTDVANQDGGTLNGWTLDICVETVDCDKEVKNINASGEGSLTEVISCAQNGDTITFHPDLASSTIVVDSTVIIAKSLVIIGPASGNMTIDGGLTDQCIRTTIGTTVVLENFSIKAGTGADGSGIYNLGSLTLRDIGVFGGGNDAAIKNNGELLMEGQCTIEQ